MLGTFRDQLRAKLDVQSRKLDLADLYSRILTEWMKPSTSPAATESRILLSQDPADDPFELVERQKERLSELVDKFKSVVFEPLETSESDIYAFLDSLFPDDDSRKSLESLREKLRKEGEALMSGTAPFDEDSLTRCIRGLLTEDILSDEKQAILRDFLGSPVALREIADVLNMRYSDLKNWRWDAGDDGIRVMPRQGLNGASSPFYIFV